MIRLVSWNVNRLQLWDEITELDVDLALLQEAAPTPGDIVFEVLPGAMDTWGTSGWEQRPWQTAIARLSDRIRLEPIVSGEISGADRTALPISRSGTIAAARVLRDDKPLFVAISVYAPWERYLGADKPMWADGSAHRILSDLAPLLWSQRRLPVVVAGDWNILRGYGEHGAEYNRRRYDNVFQRAQALELECVGPEFPNGRKADPHPAELPEDSKCVPTFHHSGQTPETATRQLDFVFASKFIQNRIAVKALNEPAEWGPSDHCRVMIEVDL